MVCTLGAAVDGAISSSPRVPAGRISTLVETASVSAALSRHYCLSVVKTDAADAEAICKAVTQPTIRFVPVKTEAQQAVLMSHRTRDFLTRQLT